MVDCIDGPGGIKENRVPVAPNFHYYIPHCLSILFVTYFLHCTWVLGFLWVVAGRM